MISALMLGAALAIGALLFVLQPLFGDSSGRLSVRRIESPIESSDASAVDALREIEFDRETGKLADGDYASLRDEYTRKAAAELRASDATSAASVATSAAAAEALIERFRARRRDCNTCGPRPEPDAVFCSRCGNHLDGRCPYCSQPVERASARFCSACGAGLAA